MWIEWPSFESDVNNNSENWELQIEQEKLKEYVKNQLNSLKEDIDLSNGISKEETIIILNKFKDSRFSWKNWWPENSAQAILAIQAWLKFNGLFDWKRIDGIYWTRDTKPAIIAFQEKWNNENPNDQIGIDGIPWKETIWRLISSISNDNWSTEQLKAEQLKAEQLKTTILNNLSSELPKWAELEINNNIEQVLESSIDSPFESESGRHYIKYWESIYYNSQWKKDNTWWKITDDWYYMKANDTFLVWTWWYSSGFWWGGPRSYSLFKEEWKEGLYNKDWEALNKEWKLYVVESDNYWKYYYNSEWFSCDKEWLSIENNINEIKSSIISSNDEIEYIESGWTLTLKKDFILNYNWEQYLIQSLWSNNFENWEFETSPYWTDKKFTKEEFINLVINRSKIIKSSLEFLDIRNNSPENSKEFYESSINIFNSWLKLNDIQRQVMWANWAVWHTVVSKWSEVSYSDVIEYLPILEKNWWISEYDTLMRYYELSWNNEKAKEYANKIITSVWNGDNNEYKGEIEKANSILSINLKDIQSSSLKGTNNSTENIESWNEFKNSFESANSWKEAMKIYMKLVKENWRASISNPRGIAKILGEWRKNKNASELEVNTYKKNLKDILSK